MKRIWFMIWTLSIYDAAATSLAIGFVLALVWR